MEWGDPDKFEPLAHVKQTFVLPYVNPDANIVEIGAGDGCWTQYLTSAKQVIAVDYYQPILDELKKNFNQPNMTFIKNNGDDFPGIPEQSVDFLFSFGTFVHLDLDIIDNYLRNMKALLKPSSNMVIQYADKTKPLGISNPGFSDNTPEKMQNMVLSHGYKVHEEDLTTLPHSSIIRFGLE